MSSNATAGQMTAMGVMGALIIIMQTMIHAFFPNSFWQLVQDNTQFWAALQLLLTYVALHVGAFRNGHEDEAIPPAPPIAAAH